MLGSHKRTHLQANASRNLAQRGMPDILWRNLPSKRRKVQQQKSDLDYLTLNQLLNASFGYKMPFMQESKTEFHSFRDASTKSTDALEEDQGPSNWITYLQQRSQLASSCQDSYGMLTKAKPYPNGCPGYHDKRDHILSDFRQIHSIGASRSPQQLTERLVEIRRCVLKLLMEEELMLNEYIRAYLNDPFSYSPVDKSQTHRCFGVIQRSTRTYTEPAYLRKCQLYCDLTEKAHQRLRVLDHLLKQNNITQIQSQKFMMELQGPGLIETQYIAKRPLEKMNYQRPWKSSGVDWLALIANQKQREMSKGDKQQLSQSTDVTQIDTRTNQQPEYIRAKTQMRDQFGGIVITTQEMQGHSEDVRTAIANTHFTQELLHKTSQRMKHLFRQLEELEFIDSAKSITAGFIAQVQVLLRNKKRTYINGVLTQLDLDFEEQTENIDLSQLFGYDELKELAGANLHYSISIKSPQQNARQLDRSKEQLSDFISLCYDAAQRLTQMALYMEGIISMNDSTRTLALHEVLKGLGKSLINSQFEEPLIAQVDYIMQGKNPFATIPIKRQSIIDVLKRKFGLYDEPTRLLANVLEADQVLVMSRIDAIEFIDPQRAAELRAHLEDTRLHAETIKQSQEDIETLLQQSLISFEGRRANGGVEVLKESIQESLVNYCRLEMNNSNLYHNIGIHTFADYSQLVTRHQLNTDAYAKKQISAEQFMRATWDIRFLIKHKNDYDRSLREGAIVNKKTIQKAIDGVDITQIVYQPGVNGFNNERFTQQPTALLQEDCIKKQVTIHQQPQIIPTAIKANMINLQQQMQQQKDERYQIHPMEQSNKKANSIMNPEEIQNDQKDDLGDNTITDRSSSGQNDRSLTQSNRLKKNSQRELDGKLGNGINLLSQQSSRSRNQHQKSKGQSEKFPFAKAAVVDHRFNGAQLKHTLIMTFYSQSCSRFYECYYSTLDKKGKLALRLADEYIKNHNIQFNGQNVESNAPIRSHLLKIRYVVTANGKVIPQYKQVNAQQQVKEQEEKDNGGDEGN